MNKYVGVPTLDQPTYNWPCEKHGNCKYNPATFNVLPCDLCIVIAKANRTGNFNLLNSNAKSVVVIGILGNIICSPLNLPLRIVASMRFGVSF